MKKYIKPSLKSRDIKPVLLIGASDSQPKVDDPDNQFAKDNLIDFVGIEDSEE